MKFHFVLTDPCQRKQERELQLLAPEEQEAVVRNWATLAHLSAKPIKKAFRLQNVMMLEVGNVDTLYHTVLRYQKATCITLLIILLLFS